MMDFDAPVLDEAGTDLVRTEGGIDFHFRLDEGDDIIQAEPEIMFY